MVEQGRLLFTGWLNRPWRLVQNDGEIDLFPLLEDVLLAVAGHPAQHEHTRDSYLFEADQSSDFDLLYEADTNPILMKRDDFGMSNVGAYLGSALGWLNGRKVLVKIGKQRFAIKADPTEDVHIVRFFGRGNSCRIQEGDEKSICKAGTTDTCIFLTFGPNGFECDKFNDPLARTLLGRHAKGTMRASRIGNCGVNGREESSRDRTPHVLRSAIEPDTEAPPVLDLPDSERTRLEKCKLGQPEATP